MNNASEKILKDYLATGLSPEEIQEIKKNVATLQDRCRASNGGWLCKRCLMKCSYGGSNVISADGYGK